MNREVFFLLPQVGGVRWVFRFLARDGWLVEASGRVFHAVGPSFPSPPGCGSKICTQNGTLVNGNMEQHLRFPGLILTHTHMVFNLFLPSGFNRKCSKLTGKCIYLYMGQMSRCGACSLRWSPPSPLCTFGGFTRCFGAPIRPLQFA